MTIGAAGTGVGAGPGAEAARPQAARAHVNANVVWAPLVDHDPNNNGIAFLVLVKGGELPGAQGPSEALREIAAPRHISGYEAWMVGDRHG